MRTDLWRSAVIGAGLFVLGAFAGWLAKGIDTGAQTGAALETPFGAGAGITRQNRSSQLSQKETDQQDGLFLNRMHDLLSIGNSRKRSQLIAGIADDLDAAQIREALAQLDRVRVSARHEVRKALLARWGELAPEDALTFAKALPGPLERNESVEAVVSGWVEQDSGAAERWVTTLPEGVMKRMALDSLLGGIAVTDPKHALSLANSRSRLFTIGRRGLGPPLWQSVLYKWVQDDPAAAAAAVAELPEGVGHSTGINLVAKGWAEADFDRAAAWAETQTQSSDRDSALFAVANVLLHKDANAAVTWVKKLPDDPAKAHILEIASYNWLRNGVDPTAAMDLTLMLPRGRSRDNDLYSNLCLWVEKDPKAALTWAESQSEDRVRQNSEIAGAGNWLEHNPAGASEWMASRPAGPEKDALLQGALDLVTKGNNRTYAGPLIMSMSREAVQTAARWIAEISDRDVQEKTYESLATKWLAQDSQSATAWIKSSTLPQEAKDRLLNVKAQ